MDRGKTLLTQYKADFIYTEDIIQDTNSDKQHYITIQSSSQISRKKKLTCRILVNHQNMEIPNRNPKGDKKTTCAPTTSLHLNSTSASHQSIELSIPPSQVPTTVLALEPTFQLHPHGQEMHLHLVQNAYSDGKGHLGFLSFT